MWQYEVAKIIPAFASGILFTGVVMFGYLAARMRHRTYSVMLAMGVLGLLFTSAEVLTIMIGSVMQRPDISVQFNRIGHVAAAYFIAVLPFLLYAILTPGKMFGRINKVAAVLGVGFAASVTVLAYVVPDLYISVTQTHGDLQNAYLDYGRGITGPVYVARDIALGVMVLYSLAAIVSDMIRNLRYQYLGPILIGILGALFFAADDIIHVYTGFHFGFFRGVEYARTPIGITVFVVSAMATLFNRYIRQTKELEAATAISEWSRNQLANTNARLSRFVPAEFIRALGKSDITQVEFGDHVQREMTVLVADIRSFTRISEQMSPKENFDFLNSYLRVMTPIIRRHGGFIDKFIGDAIMALFPDRADDAVQAAVQMHQELEAYNAHAGTHGPISIGVGIHTGEMMLGTVGNAERMDGTVISDAVNLGSRIESVTKYYGLRIGISESTFAQLDDATAYHFRFIGKVKVKGKRQALSVFEIFDGDDEDLIRRKRDSQRQFEHGVTAFFLGQHDVAQQALEQVLRVAPEDTTAAVYMSSLRGDVHAPSMVSFDLVDEAEPVDG